MAIASAVIGVVGLVASERRSKKAAKKQEQAVEIQGKRAALENASARRKQVAEARRLRATTVAQGEAAGISGGSQVSGAVSAVGTQAATNISFLRQLEGFDVARGRALSVAAREQGRAATFAAISGFATSGAGREVTSQIGSFFKEQ